MSFPATDICSENFGKGPPRAPARRAPRALLRLLFALLLPAGCLPESFVITDGDGDGHPVDRDGRGDCDDADPSTFPGALEVCDGRDNSCNGRIDEGAPDEDGDGTADCQDEEECDGADNDGDGEIDEDFPDSDDDGTADCQDEEECDGADNDGDGEIDEQFPDTDGDGTADCVDPDDCEDDTDGDGTVDCLDAEQCDGIDNDGDGKVDEGFTDSDRDGRADCVDLESCDGRDNDGDGKVDEGFADSNGDGIPDCASPELCDGRDNDGDGAIDEGFDADWKGGADCIDDDGDGFTELKGDCDDTSASIRPGVSYELDDGRDNDCDGEIDEANDVAGAAYQISGAPAGSRAGAAIAVADLDGDGALERVIGAPGETDGEGDPPAGCVYLEPGSAALPTAGKLVNARTLTLSTPGDRFGEALAIGIDGDGTARFLAVGAPGASSDTGMVAVWPVGGTLQGLTSVKPARLYGALPGDGFGATLADVGDLDGDGLPELAVGAAGAVSPLFPDTGAAGALFLFAGAALEPEAVLTAGDAFAVLSGERAGERFAASFAAVDDLDADGLSELVVGIPGADSGELAAAGQVRLVFGSALLEGCARACGLRIDGLEAGSELGIRVAALGDITLDGLPDFAVAAGPAASVDPPSWRPELYLFQGADAATLDPDGDGLLPAMEAYIIQAVEHATTTRALTLFGEGDVDGDGLVDLLIGIPTDAGDPTFAHEGLVVVQTLVDLVFGASLEEGYARFISQSPAALGAGLGAADLDGKGMMELLLGAPEAGGGAVYVYPGE